MVAEDEDALLCDLAETYGVYDWHSLPVQTLAVLACGLGENARIWRKSAGRRLTTEQTLLAAIADRLGTLVWMKTRDGAKGRNRPPSLLEALTGDREPQAVGFATGEDFAARWEWLRKEAGEHGG